MENGIKPLFNADEAEEYLTSLAVSYRNTANDIFSRDNEGRHPSEQHYSAEYQKYVGMQIAMREVLEYFSKFDLGPNKETVDRVLDILQAESEGRVVILPCKAGDKVWRIVDMESHTAYKNYVDEVQARPVGVPFRDILGGYSLIPLDAFGKTAFLTKEEAAAALEKHFAEKEGQQ